MKRILSILTTAILISTLLVGCGSKEVTPKQDPLLGTWAIDYVEADGVKYTISELEAMGDESLSGTQLVIKEGGKAYASDNTSGGIVDWEKNEDTITIGVMDCTLKDGVLSFEYGDGMIYMKKISDSQTIGDPQPSEQSSTPTEESKPSAKPEPKPENIQIKESPDKYTWYIKNYVGKNCASIGYTSLGGDRFDRYDSALLEIIFITPDGSYIDIEDDNELKQYVVAGQNLAPNTEMKLTFQKDSDGKEYDYLIESQSYEEIVLTVKKVNSSDSPAAVPATPDPAPDKYTQYIVDYTGRNLASCGYTSLGGDLMHKYGSAIVKLVIVSEDGAYVDPEDEESLQGYVVTSQGIAPNTKMDLTFQKNSDGKEYDNLVETQSIKEIDLYVRPIGN